MASGRLTKPSWWASARSWPTTPGSTSAWSTGYSPQPVIVDSRLRFPPYANLLAQRPLPLDRHQRRGRPRAPGSPGSHRGPGNPPAGQQRLVDLAALLERLAEMGLNSLMVEGGAQIITSFLASRLVDQVILTIAPLLVGGLRVVDNLGYSKLRRFPRLSNLIYQRLGEDLVLMGEPDWEA